jgi:hypothetical protein
MTNSCLRRPRSLSVTHQTQTRRNLNLLLIGAYQPFVRHGCGTVYVMVNCNPTKSISSTTLARLMLKKRKCQLSHRLQ